MAILRSLSATALLSAAATMAQTGPAASVDLDNGAEPYPMVLTPARLRQPLQDVPASVTVLTAETLWSFGITSLPEALRLVPGMAITQTSGPDFRINYHGTNLLSPRRMNVLVDGVSVYQPLFSRVDWKNLPVTLLDIDRIEVTRGPNSAAYGPNSMLAIVNIITKHPRDVDRATLSTTLGTRGTVDVTARLAATLGPTALRLTLSQEGDRGYDHLSRISGGGHDSTRLQRINLRSQTLLSASTRLDVDAGYVGGTKEVPFVESYQRSFPDQKVRDHFVSASITHSPEPAHEVQVLASYWRDRVRQPWFTCMPTAFVLPEMYTLWRANPGYARSILAGRRPTGGTPQDDLLAMQALQAIARLGPGGAMAPTCGTPNHNLSESRFDIELQDTYVFSDRLRTVAGLGARQHRGHSETFMGRSVRNSGGRAFGNAEFKPTDWLTVNAGAYVERDQTSGTTVSPRFAANFRLSPAQTLRLVWSRGSRTPDVHEQRTEWVYSLHDAQPPLNGSSHVRFFQSAHSTGGLRSERITSREIGYLLNLPASGLLLDAKLFDDRLSDLISEKLQVSDFRPSNDNAVRLSGVELQLNLDLTPQWSAFAHYSYLRNHAATTVLERSQYSRHSGAAGLSHAFGGGWSASLAYYGASAEAPGQRHFGREDLAVHKRLQHDGLRGRGSLIVRRLDNKTVGYFRDVGSWPQSEYHHRLQWLGQLELNF
ncbi:TonB-dependent receptor plug domain-containing protein [Eleftheria terrae]|uniref:TonB-dependent receptor plug domain-containing protein n=1 Tax=Eleftheria terrae TaxID=1597781 RepID=UPI00263ACECF|nr:TonB-dependent receptor [Eleftheria terrae]WKB50695.1 TonB-dependent receptor [Eleftheria terrae]